MATVELQRRAAELSRILAANGWGVIGVGDVAGGVAVSAAKASSLVRAVTVAEAMAQLSALVSQFRWELTDYQIDSGRHVARLSSL